MSDKKYVIKILAPWMIEELIAFSKQSNFEIILLRQQDKFYDEGLKKLKDNGIKIHTKPNSFDQFPKKLAIAIKFLFSNLAKFKFNYNAIIGIKSIVWFLKIDISLFSERSNIHAQFATQAALISLLIKRHYNDKPEYSFTFHAYDIYFHNKWFKLMTDESFCCFSISEYNIKYVEKHYLQSDKIKLSRLGVFRKPIKNKKSLKFKMNKNFNIGLLSWFIEKKGVIFLLEAMKELSEQKDLRIKLFIAGEGPLKENYLSYIENNNLDDCVSLGGAINDEEKKDFFKSLDAFVLPSVSIKNDQDGIPVVLMEAISYGLPIISTDVSGIPEICINEFNGLLVQEKNVKELVSAIKSLFSEEDNYRDYSVNSYKLSSEYDIDRNSTQKLKMINWIN